MFLEQESLSQLDVWLIHSEVISGSLFLIDRSFNWWSRFQTKKTGLRKITGSIEPRFLETATYSKYSTLFYAFILQISRNQYSACVGGCLKYWKVGAWLRCTGLISSTPPPTFFQENLPFYNLFGDDDWIKLALLRCFDRLMWAEYWG